MSGFHLKIRLKRVKLYCLYHDSYDQETTWLISLTDYKITHPGMVKAVNQEDNL